MKGKKGIALILAVGILAVLAAIATSFALNMRLEYKAAANYYEGVKARYLAEAALQRAIAELKAHVKESAFDHLGETWTLVTEETISSTAKREIKDTQRWINVNNANQTLLTNLFNQLTLPTGTTSSSLYIKINSFGSLPNRGYKSLQELKSKAGLTDGEYDVIKDHVTAHSYFDSNAGNRSPINVNTVSGVVLKAVLRGVGSIPQATADSLADQIYARVRVPTADPFTSWGEFNSFIDSSPASAYATQIKNNCNPNNADDKVTTEFCFHSGGYYTITATGTVDGAERTITAIVKIYEVLNYTTKAQFAGGTAERVTWLNSCPVNSNALFGVYPPAAQQQIDGSIKLGYWDNFDEDRNYTKTQWYKNLTAYVSDSDFNNLGVTSTGALVTTEGVRCDLWNATSGWDWTWDNFSLRVYANEYYILNASQMKDVAWVIFRGSNATIPITNSPAVLHTRTGALTWDQSGYGYRNIDVGLPGVGGAITFLTIAQYTAQTGYGAATAITDRWRYSTGQVRIFNSYANNNVENYDNSSWRSGLPYSQIKTFNILANGTTISVDTWDNAGNRASPYPFSRTISGINTSGRAVLYSNNVKTAWDNLRIIPANGNYTSPAINPLGGINNVEWGTITGTITQPNAGNIVLKTDVSGTDEINLENISPFLPLNGAKSASLKYTATLTTTNPYRETPVLEDVTITYLPETKIVSYISSSQ